jgi:hypothetical protein
MIGKYTRSLIRGGSSKDARTPASTRGRSKPTSRPLFEGYLRFGLPGHLLENVAV